MVSGGRQQIRLGLLLQSEGAISELLHRLLINYFHVFARCFDNRRIFFELGDFPRCHSVNVDIGLCLRLLACNFDLVLERGGIHGNIVLPQVQLVHLPVVKVDQVPDWALEPIIFVILDYALSNILFLGREVVLDVLQVDLLFVDFVSGAEIFLIFVA